MARHRFLQTTLTVVILLSLATGAYADTKVVISHSRAGLGISLGARIGSPIMAPHHSPPAPRPVVITPPVRHRPIRWYTPHVGPVVVPPPVVRRVVIEPAPIVTVGTSVPVSVIAITVWITNSNGSQTSVRLTREGAWYVGPRGEYYSQMPTNEQLRVVYGF